MGASLFARARTRWHGPTDLRKQRVQVLREATEAPTSAASLSLRVPLLNHLFAWWVPASAQVFGLLAGLVVVLTKPLKVKLLDLETALCRNLPFEISPLPR